MRSKPYIRCVCCEIFFETVEMLKAHVASCPSHPAVKENGALKTDLRVVADLIERDPDLLTLKEWAADVRKRFPK